MNLHEIYQATHNAGIIFPMAIMLLEDDDDRRFVSQIYLDYRKLMYVVAREYFGQVKEDLDDAIGSTIERICRYCSTIRHIPEEGMKAYIVSVTGNTCRDLLRKKKKREELIDYSYTQERLEEIPDEVTVYKTVFDVGSTSDLEKAFHLLSSREQELIRMHHVDGIDIKTIAYELGINYGAARTALSRARNHLIEIVKREGQKQDD